ncbi:hypothetical protein MG293_001150 [Ovis ammon polii]|uniref:Uncharacterized protein n=1 Tax=Ovis ammon polii TaxID=230172 RepID=A0AAD4UQW6_OVIAM|nr:hypothetical protein MG293_001150 [Ovis ammon polii]
MDYNPPGSSVHGISQPKVCFYQSNLCYQTSGTGWWCSFKLSQRESASTTPPIAISSSLLTKLTRRTTDRKSEFLKTLKDDRNGDVSESRESEKLEDSEGNSTPEPKENGEEGCHQNGLTLPVKEDREALSHSLEAEHRLLKAMGWQEYPENDENCLPLTEDELRESYMKTAADKKWLWKEWLLAESKFQPILPLEKHLQSRV